MNERRSIQDIVPPARSKPLRPRPPVEDEVEKEAHSPKLPLKKTKRAKSGKGGMLGIALAVLLIVGAAFGVVSTVFHRAKVTITPYAFTVTVADTFGVAQDGEQLAYTTLSFETSQSQTVSSTASEYVEDRAQGTIVVYNEYSTQGQRLITNTRFETPEGLIFRIKSPVTVPGYTTSGGQKQPGTVSVTVYADEPGEDYNITPTSFTIPGLAGSAQFDEMYARSSEAMAGGFIGEKAVVEEGVRTQTIANLKSELDRAVRAGLLERLVEGQLLLPDTVTVEFIEQPDRKADDGAEVTVKAVAMAPVFNEADLAAVIAQDDGVVFDAPLRIENKDAMTIQAQTSEEDGVTGLLVSGEAILIAAIDTDKFVRDIVGKDQGSVGAALTRYPGIKDLNLSVYPFWRQTLPGDTGRFTVVFDE